MRQACNVAYAEQTENLDADELKQFNRDLDLVPGEKRRMLSRGTNKLMQAMGMARR